MLIALAKTLPAAAVGQFSLGLAISAPIFMLTNLQLRSLQATSASDLFDFRDYLSFRLVTTTIGFLVIAGVALTVDYKGPTKVVIVAVGAAKAIEAIVDAIYGHLQKAEKMDSIALSMLARGCLSLTCLVGTVILTGNLFLGILALVVSSITILLAIDIPNVRRLRVGHDGGRVKRDELDNRFTPRWTPATLAGIARLGLPLGVASLLLTLAATAPRYFLEHWQGEQALGYFSALAYPTVAFSIIVSAFGQAATPRMANAYSRDRREFVRIVITLAAVPFLMILVALLICAGLGPRLLALMYREEYAKYFNVFLVLLVSGLAWALASVLGYAATASRRLRKQAPVSAVICVAGVAISWLTIPNHGLAGAGIAMLLTGTVAILLYSLTFAWKQDESMSSR